RQEASVILAPEKPVEVRLVDVQGQPAGGLVVRVGKLSGMLEPQPDDARGAQNVWPAPATTAADGRVRMLGLAAETEATFEIDDPRFAHQVFSYNGAGANEQELRPGATITLLPAQTVDIRVTRADDAEPLASAQVTVRAMEKNVSPSTDTVKARTDREGHARVVGWPAISYRIEVHPPDGEPYLPDWRDITWPKAAVELSVNFRVRRGVVVRGRVVEGADCTPVAGAWLVYYQTSRGNPRRLDLPSIEAVSNAQGR